MKRHCSIACAALALLAGLAALRAVALAQSGRGTMHGYVAFQGVGWLDLPRTKTKAHIELRATTEGNHSVYTADTDEHGIYDLKTVVMGEYKLRISSPGFKTYETDLYIPSDFECKLATMLKKATQGSGKTK